jgi:hypothetical protein
MDTKEQMNICTLQDLRFASNITEDSSLVGMPDPEDDGPLIQQQSITTKKV